MPQTPDQIIMSRKELGQIDMVRHASRDKMACRRYMDSSVGSSQYYNEGTNGTAFNDLDLILDQAIGNIPHLQINIRTKAAALAMVKPDWYVECQDEDLVKIPGVYMAHLWKKNDWQRVVKKTIVKRAIMGIGCIAALWDDERGPCLEHVHLYDLIIDPHVIDWHDLRWAARRVMMPRDEARKRFPAHADLLGKVAPQAQGGSDTPKMKALELWVYWDKDTEATMYGKTVLEKSDNLYGRVPLRFLLGDIDPTSEFDKGDSDSCTGMVALRTRLDDRLNNQAMHGGSMTFINNDSGLTTADKKNIESGKQQSIFFVDTSDFERLIHRTESEPMNPALLEANKSMQQAMDSAQAVNGYMRGVAPEGTKFATEVAATEGQSGALGTQARGEYEAFLDHLTDDIRDMTIQFAKPETPEENLLIEALLSVQEMCTIEGSTEYKNPATERQSALAFGQAMMPFIQMQIVDPVAVALEVIRAWKKGDAKKFLNPQLAQMLQQQQMMQEHGLSQLGQPGQQPPSGVSPPNGAAQGGALPSSPPPAAPNTAAQPPQMMTGA